MPLFVEDFSRHFHFLSCDLSPVVANIFMEEFDIEALLAAVIRPKLWLRYVDDTFVIWNYGDEQLEDFLSFLNGRHRNIEFTMEKETNGSLPFLDVQVKKCMGSLDTFVYRKPTHTDRYLPFTSHHHPRVKTQRQSQKDLWTKLQ